MVVGDDLESCTLALPVWRLEGSLSFVLMTFSARPSTSAPVVVLVCRVIVVFVLLPAVALLVASLVDTLRTDVFGLPCFLIPPLITFYI